MLVDGGSDAISNEEEDARGPPNCRKPALERLGGVWVRVPNQNCLSVWLEHVTHSSTVT